MAATMTIFGIWYDPAADSQPPAHEVAALPIVSPSAVAFCLIWYL